MSIKRCFKCLCEKPLDAFYAHNRMGDGRLGKCKDCTKEDVRLHRQQNLERVRAYDRMRGSMPHRVAARKEYGQTKAGKIAYARAHNKYAVNNAKKRAAHIALGNAVRDKRVVRWPVCAMPECDKKPQGHHPDYDRPLDVVWLCPKHHKQAHAIVANEERARGAA